MNDIDHWNSWWPMPGLFQNSHRRWGPSEEPSDKGEAIVGWDTCHTLCIDAIHIGLICVKPSMGK
jgi:hypothetical protein